MGDVVRLKNDAEKAPKKDSEMQLKFPVAVGIIRENPDWADIVQP